jgi:Fic family protein/DNA-binding XRE family transcriptional regulator
MTIIEKLKLIQKYTNLSQTVLSQKLGVSFVSINKWLNNKATPRPKIQAKIDELYLEVTGQKIIPDSVLESKKQNIHSISKEYSNIIKEILNNKDIYDEFVLKLTYHSNSIEGSTLSERDTAAIIFDNVALPNKTLIEQLEAKNHQTAVEHLFGHLSKGGEINELLILKLHSVLLNGIYSDAGLYRRHAVRIGGSNVPTANYLKINELMSELFIDIDREKSADIIKQVSSVHSKFEQIHPFPDGNGRIGRLLMTAMLLKQNIAPAVIHQENKQLYYTYLNKSQLKGDSSQLEDFICDAIADGFKILKRENI